jgi:hypothetical protein
MTLHRPASVDGLATAPHSSFAPLVRSGDVLSWEPI